MDTSVYTKNYTAPPVNRKEILRYAGAKEESLELRELIDSCLAEAMPQLSYRVCYRVLPVSLADGELDLGFARVRSESLSRRLLGCSETVLFAATVGQGIDRLIARAGAASPARAAIFQAIGAERVESLSDLFESEVTTLTSRGEYETRPRFSPGYGDLPLSLQRDVFMALDCPRHIGVSLNSSLLMSPSKSVTAIIGIYRTR